MSKEHSNAMVEKHQCQKARARSVTEIAESRTFCHIGTMMFSLLEHNSSLNILH